MRSVARAFVEIGGVRASRPPGASPEPIPHGAPATLPPALRPLLLARAKDAPARTPARCRYDERDKARLVLSPRPRAPRPRTPSARHDGGRPEAAARSRAAGAGGGEGEGAQALVGRRRRAALHGRARARRARARGAQRAADAQQPAREPRDGADDAAPRPPLRTPQLLGEPRAADDAVRAAARGDADDEAQAADRGLAALP